MCEVARWATKMGEIRNLAGQTRPEDALARKLQEGHLVRASLKTGFDPRRVRKMAGDFSVEPHSRECGTVLNTFVQTRSYAPRANGNDAY